MNNLTQFTKNLLEWYVREARPFFADILPTEKLAEFDKDFESLQNKLKNLDTELVVCFLGTSGVGKSTLLNAIVDGQQSLVPAGGVGPLTAQALAVRYAPKPRLEVEYHGVKMIYQTYFGLEQMYKAEIGSLPNVDDTLPDDIDESDFSEMSDAVEESKDQGSENLNTEHEEKRQQWRRRAQLLITGTQDNERNPEYLIDCLREIVGKPRYWGTVLRSEDEKQIQKIQQILTLIKENNNSPLQMDASQGEDVFKQAVHDHAIGFMAPLIKNLTISWPAPALEHGLTLVDLPGVGIMRDAHKEVTRGWIRGKAKALVLVVDHRGISDAVGKALHQSEFLNSLLYSADEPDEDPVVIVAVTRIDDIANTYYQSDKTKKRYQHFLSIAEEVQNRMRHDLQNQLGSIWLQASEVTEERQKVAKNLLETLQVHAISAPEYTRLLDQDEDNPSFLKTIEQTGIPKLIQSLDDLSHARTQNLIGHLNEFAYSFRDTLGAQLRIIESQWTDQQHAREEAEKLKAELANFSLPLREEFNLRRGAYREFLKTGIPEKIKDLVNQASETASRDISKYMQRVSYSHWATLRASVRRGGMYHGASDIDLPTEFALRFEEPIAALWSKEILSKLRIRTKEYGKDCLDLANQLAEWVDRKGDQVRGEAVKAQYEALQASSKKLEAVGKEMAREMREEAKAGLVTAIEKKIRKECSEFVSRNDDRGRGVKNRILDLYRELADDVSSVAKPPALKILQKAYSEAEAEILQALESFSDPLKSISNAIIVSEEQRIANSDIKKRDTVLAEVRAVLAELPEDIH